MQSAIHEGYEYQDYFSVSIILQLIMQQTDAEIVIDRKDFKGDKFDDLKVKTSKECIEYQIKYSDKESAHTLTKDDFSNGNGHDTALSDLYFSWKNNKKKNGVVKVILCLAWSKPAENDKITQYLKPIQDQFLPFPSSAYRFDGQLFWPNGKKPQNTWRKFNSEIQNGSIDREDFLSFCNELTILLEMPKASLDLKNPDGLECVIIRQVEKLGIGIYPNNSLTVEGIVNKLATEVKRSRAMGNRLNTKFLCGRLGIIMDYGKFDQRFPVDYTHRIILNDEIEKLCIAIQDSTRLLLVGNPGSGKSWLVDELINKLEFSGNSVIHYNCFQSLQDDISLKRIRITSLYGNLVAQIIEQYPELVECKNTLFGADKSELENLLKQIKEKFYLIVDGLDHILREYELNKDVISRSETDIISELIKISFPDNCYVLISSQAINDLDQFKDKGFSAFCIEPWKVEQVEDLMAKYQVADVNLDFDPSLIVSNYLLKKSQGNALYLSYILRQLQDKVITKEMIDDIPDYDISLSGYYTYLYTKVRSTHTVFALCGADFYLSQNDLMEITGIGEFVKEDLSLLHPLLIENVLSGGFSIYHESFRRFVLSLLEQNNVDVEKNVFGIIADWLNQKPLFEFDKAFYYLPELQYKIKRDNDNIALIEEAFVLNAIRDGYSRERIKINLNYMIRSAGRLRNIIALTTASELLSMLDDLNDIENIAEEYFNALCGIKGVDKINQLMQLDGKPMYDSKIGLIACYIVSKAGATPWWDLYLDTDSKPHDLEEAKYYFRFLFDKQGIDIIPQIMKSLENEEVSIRYKSIQIAYNELIDYITYKDILLIAEEQQLTHWKDYLVFIQTGYYDNIDISGEAVLDNIKKIKAFKIVGEDNVTVFKEFLSQIYHLAEQGEKIFINEIISEYENINWFYNWVIYCIRLAELSAQSDSQIESDYVLDIMQLLLLDTEVFKGEPRTCDLYYIQHELTNSYKQAIRFVENSGTLHDIKKAFTILEQLDDKTGTSLDHYMGGPLPDSEFLELISTFLTSDNFDLLKPYLIRTQEKIEKNEVYENIATAKLRFVNLLSKYNIDEARIYFEECTQYLVAYGFHKDIIIEQILDSYDLFFETISDNPKDERDTITKMTFALLDHTDGRDTNHFLNKWFDKLLETDPRYALSFLTGFQVEHGINWIVQNMVLSVIEKYCTDYEYSLIVISLIESLPNDMCSRLINASTEVFKTLFKQFICLSGDKALLIKKRMNELVVNVVSRFNILDKPWPGINSWEAGSIEEFLRTVYAAGFDVKQYLDYFHFQSAETDFDPKEKNGIGIAVESKKSRFEASSLQGAIKWFEVHDLSEQDIPDICVFLNNYQDEKNILLGALKQIIKASSWNYGKEKKRLILQIAKYLNLTANEMAEVHMVLYLNSYEWTSSLVDVNEFMKSIELNPEVAWDTLYHELPEIIISRSGRIAKGLIQALYASVYDKNCIISIWESVFRIMKLRFPNLDQYPLDFVSEEADEQDGCRNSLLARFADGGKEQFLSVYAFLVDIAEEKKYIEFTSAVSFCLEHFNNFNLVTQVAVADLLSSYSFQLPKECQKRLIQAIDKIYPTGNLLLDIIFSKYTVYKSFLTKSVKKHAPDYLELEDIEFYLAEKMYDLGRIDRRNVPNDYAKYSYYHDPIMGILMKFGIDYESLYVKLCSSEKLNNNIRKFVSNSTSIPEMNTVYKSYAMQYALHAIIKKAYLERVPELIPISLIQLMPDFVGMYRTFKIRELAPSVRLYEETDSQRDLTIDETEYTRIGCTEIKRKIDFREVKYTLVYEGIVPLSFNNKNMFPFNQYFVTSFEDENVYEIETDTRLLIGLYRSLDKKMEDNCYLWPDKYILEFLDLHKEYDSLNERYIAVNQTNEVVFFMKNWRSCYMGNSDYKGNAIPLYTGTALYIKTEYLKTLQERFGNLQMVLKVKSVT